MKQSLVRLAEICVENGKPIEDIIVEDGINEKNRKCLSIIASWLTQQSASDSLDLLTFYLKSISSDSDLNDIDSIYLYETKQSFDLRKPIGFRKVGVFH